MRKTEWRGQQCPPLYTERLNGGMKQLTLYVDSQQTQSDDGTEEWTATAITLPIGVNDYGSIVSAIIDARYSNEQMQAIINNRLLGEHEDEFTAMQAYRRYAKETARNVVESIEQQVESSESEV